MIENTQATGNGATAPSQRWEYQVGHLVRPSAKHILEHIDDMAQDGWELVTSTVEPSAFMRNTNHYFYWRKAANA